MVLSICSCSDTPKNVDRVGVFWRTKCFLQLICAETCHCGGRIFKLGVFSRHYGTESDQHLFYSHVIPIMFLLVISLLEVVIVHSDVREGWAYFCEIIVHVLIVLKNRYTPAHLPHY